MRGKQGNGKNEKEKNRIMERLWVYNGKGNGKTGEGET